MFGAILGALPLVAKAFGGGAKGAESSRMSQAEMLLHQDALRQRQAEAAQQAQMQAGQLDLQRKGFTEDARGGRAKQAMLGDILANWSPTQVNVPGIKNAQISGGLQTLGQGARDSAKLMNLDALMAQLGGLKGDQFQGGGMVQMPQLSQMPKAGFMEKTGGILGTIASLGGALAPMFGGESPEDARSFLPDYSNLDMGGSIFDINPSASSTPPLSGGVSYDFGRRMPHVRF